MKTHTLPVFYLCFILFFMTFPVIAGLDRTLQNLSEDRSPALPWTIVSIYDLQFTTSPSGNSPYAGQTVRFTGIVTGIFPNGFTLAEAPGSWHGIYVFTRRFGPAIGDEITISGTVSEYYGMTEITDPFDLITLSIGNHTSPTILTCAAVPDE